MSSCAALREKPGIIARHCMEVNRFFPISKPLYVRMLCVLSSVIMSHLKKKGLCMPAKICYNSGQLVPRHCANS